MKYTLGAFITSISLGVLAYALTSNYVAGMASSGLVFGLAYMVTGMAEDLIKATIAIKATPK